MGNREDEKICVYGARVHNLKNIDVTIPRGSLTVITGLSGSGKSSLAFDTIFAEGQRRYIETFSAYARNFLGGMERPDVDKITGLSPVISIEQKTTNKNPRSTVGTTTEIYDYLRLLFARAGKAYSYVTGEPMVKYTEEKIIDMILHDYAGKRIFILAPLVRSRKGHYRELFEAMRRKGYLTMRVDGEIVEIKQGMKVDRYKNHDIEVVIDKLAVKTDGMADERLKKSVQIAMKQGEGLIMILDKDTNTLKHFSKRLMCPTTGISYSDPAPNNFSFNSPQGACQRCKGLGKVSEIDLSKVMPNRQQSIHEGGIIPLGKYKSQLIFWQIDAILKKYDCDLKTKIADIPDEAMNEILYGSLENVRIDKDVVHTSSDYFVAFDGVVKYLRDVMENDESTSGQKWADQFMAECECPECHGQRLNREALSYKIWDKNIAELASMDIKELSQWFDDLQREEPDPELQNAKLDEKQRQIASEIIKEIRTRINFLLDVGLDYLSLNRQSASLSGGESQRIPLHPRRAEHRPAPARQRATDSFAQGPARPGQHGHRGGTRRRHDAGSRLYRGHRSEGGQKRRRGGLPGNACRDAQDRHRDGQLPERQTENRDTTGAPTRQRQAYRGAWREGQQPETRRCRLPAWQAHRRDGRQRQRKVDTHQRDPSAHPVATLLPLAEAPHALRCD